MLTNESSIDRALRIVLGIVVLSLVVVGPQTMWGLLGLVPLLTGLIGFCPLYRVLAAGHRDKEARRTLHLGIAQCTHQTPHAHGLRLVLGVDDRAPDSTDHLGRLVGHDLRLEHRRECVERAR